MLNTISWNSFILSSIVLTVLYYVILVIKFRLSQPRFLKFDNGGTLFGKYQVGHNHETIDTITSMELETGSVPYKLAKELRAQLQALLQSAAQKKLSKEALLIAIQLKIEPYAQLKLTPFRAALNNYIEAECADQCSFHIEEQDLEFIWL